MEFFFSVRSLLPQFSNGWQLRRLYSLHAPFAKSICIGLAKAVALVRAGSTGMFRP
jgi:hypothetical protein